MHYIILTKLEYPTSISLRIKGLTPTENEILSKKFKENKMNFSVESNVMEIDSNAVDLLNILAHEFRYRVVSQAMAMELSTLGGRSFQIEKIVWTLEQSGCHHI